MPTMTEETPPVTTALDPDDFDKPASRGFVRYELVTTRSELREVSGGGLLHAAE